MTKFQTFPNGDANSRDFGGGGNRTRVLGPSENQDLQVVCSNGHSLTPDNVRIDRYLDGRVHRRCLTCYRDYQREYKRRRRQNPEVAERDRAYSRGYMKRRRIEDPEWARKQDKQKAAWKRLNQTPERRAARRARQADDRRQRGIPSRAEYLTLKAANKGPSEPARVPFDVRALWRNAAPGSPLRRMFPCAKDLNGATWDPIRQVIVKTEGVAA